MDHVKNKCTLLELKIKKGIDEIKKGNGVYRANNESVEQFFERITKSL